MNLIGISGVAKAGKDTFYQGLKDAYPDTKFFRFSVGDEIRHDLYHFIWDNFRKDVNALTPEEKEQFRPLLAWYGDIRRKQSNGQYFIRKFEDTINQYNDMDYTIVITDIRFKEFEFDEPDFIKKYGGTLFHLTRILPDGTEAQPANDLERLNDPKVKAIADRRIIWPTIENVMQEVSSPRFNQQIARLVKTLVPQQQTSTQTDHNLY